MDPTTFVVITVVSALVNLVLFVVWFVATLRTAKACERTERNTWDALRELRAIADALVPGQPATAPQRPPPPLSPGSGWRHTSSRG